MNYANIGTFTNFFFPVYEVMLRPSDHLMNGCLNRPADQKICFEYCPLMANCLAIMTLITVTAGVSASI
jgi:hypothetical protein